MNMYEKIRHLIRTNAWYDFGIWTGISIVLAGVILLGWHQRCHKLRAKLPRAERTRS